MVNVKVLLAQAPQFFSSIEPVTALEISCYYYYYYFKDLTQRAISLYINMSCKEVIDCDLL